jgi:hypothetical protein
MKKKVKWKIGHGKSEEKGEFGNPWSECLGFRCDTPIVLGPKISSFIQASSLDSINAHNTAISMFITCIINKNKTPYPW